MAYDPEQARAERLERLRADRDRVKGNLRGQEKQVQASGKPASELLAQGIRDAMIELDRLERELEREGGQVARIAYSQHRNWPAEMHLQFERRLALARVATWESEVTSGRRPLTPQLLAAIAWDRALAAHIAAELGEGGARNSESAPTRTLSGRSALEVPTTRQGRLSASLRDGLTASLDGGAGMRSGPSRARASIMAGQAGGGRPRTPARHCPAFGRRRRRGAAGWLR